MWTIQRMDEMDDGDEERLPGELMMTAVTLKVIWEKYFNFKCLTTGCFYAGITRRRRVA